MIWLKALQILWFMFTTNFGLIYERRHNFLIKYFYFVVIRLLYRCHKIVYLLRDVISGWPYTLNWHCIFSWKLCLVRRKYLRHLKLLFSMHFYPLYNAFGSNSSNILITCHKCVCYWLNLKKIFQKIFLFRFKVGPKMQKKKLHFSAFLKWYNKNRDIVKWISGVNFTNPLA